MASKVPTRWRSWAALACVSAVFACESGALAPEQNPSSIRLDPVEVWVDEGGRAHLRATLVDELGRPIPSLPPRMSLLWGSSDPEVISVTERGEVAALRPGLAKVGVALVSREQSGLFLGGSMAAWDKTNEERIRGGTTVKVRGSLGGMEVVAGNEQEGAPGGSLPVPVVIRVLDRQFRPITGLQMKLTVVEGGGTVSPSSAATDENGEVQVQWDLGPEPGRNRAEARLQARADMAITFDAMAVGGAGTLSKSSGDGQRGTAGKLLGQPLVVLVRNSDGVPVSGASVQWQVVAGEGTVGPASSVTGSDGLASTTWTLGTKVATNTAKATVAGLASVTFQAEAYSGPVAQLVKSGGDGQSGTAGQTLAEALTVRVMDEFSNPVAGVPVSWTVTSGGGSVDKSSVATDHFGFAQTQWKLGSSGVQAVRAAISNVTPASFSATLSTTGSTGVSKVIVSPDQANIYGVGNAVKLSASAVDASGSSVSNATFTWTSLEPGVASVDGLGNVVGKALGTAMIVAAAAGISDTAAVAVQSASTTINMPELPRVTIDPRAPTFSGNVIRVAAGGNLQAALNNAMPGDRVVLASGAVFTGNFTLPPRKGAAWIALETETPLPPVGERVGSSHFGGMAKLVTPNTQPALRALPHSGGWYVRGIEFSAAPAQTLSYGIVELGLIWSADQDTYEEVPGPFTLQHIYIHGHPNLDNSRCLALNSHTTAVMDSYLSQCHAKGRDAQAIGIFNGQGPFRIENNYLEGSGENVMFGGADPRVPGLVPSDIVFRRNHLKKPGSWKGVWTVKNLFELKNAQRALVEGNVMEGSWVDAQDGFGVLFQATNQDGNGPWAVVRDVTFRNNRISDVGSCMNINAWTWSPVNLVAEHSRRVHVHNNVCERVGSQSPYGGYSRGIQLLSDLKDIVLERNTIRAPYLGIFIDASPAIHGLRISGNAFDQTAYGVFGNSTAESLRTWEVHTTGNYSFAGNAFVGRPANLYPNASGNYFPTSFSAVPAGVGADLSALSTATAGVVR